MRHSLGPVELAGRQDAIETAEMAFYDYVYPLLDDRAPPNQVALLVRLAELANSMAADISDEILSQRSNV